MRLLSIVFVLGFIHPSFSQNELPDSTSIDSLFHTNGQLHILMDIGHFHGAQVNHGRYLEFNEEGQLIVKGQYHYAPDSVRCIDCYAIHYFDQEFIEESKIKVSEIPVGVWEYYHDNGQLHEIGQYSENVRSITSRALLSGNTEFKAEGPVVVGTSIEYLKHGKWTVFDEHGYLIEQVWYYEGRIVEQRYAPNE
mgnify:CR=1 FL=1